MRLFIGTYTEPTPTSPGTKGRGVLRIEVDPQRQQWRTVGNPVPLMNPTYLAWIPERRQLLSVADGRTKPQRLVSLAIPRDESDPAELGSAPTHGQASCHIALLPGKMGAAVASYLEACLDAYHIEADGKITPQAVYPYSGKSVHARQQEAHAHQACVSPDGRSLYVCDLGSDCIWKHPLIQQRLDAQGRPGDTPRLCVGPAEEKIAVPPGEGPRHMVFDTAASRAYVIAELTGRLLVFDWLLQQDATLRFVAAVDGLPEDYRGKPSGAAIVLHPNRRMILASQRQHNSVAFFALNPSSPCTLPKRVCNLPCGGREPRDITVDRSGRWLFAANQDSDTVTVFELDPTTGLPVSEAFFAMEIGTPVCVLEEVPA